MACAVSAQCPLRARERESVACEQTSELRAAAKRDGRTARPDCVGCRGQPCWDPHLQFGTLHVNNIIFWISRWCTQVYY